MDFNRAIEYAEVIGDNSSKGAEFIIHFNTLKDGSGYACLKAPNYSREKEKTISDVKLAWETFAKGNFDRENGITSIDIVMADDTVKEGKKKTA